MKGGLLLSALLSVAMPKLEWAERAKMPAAVAGGAAAFVGDRLVYAGGTNWTEGVKRWLPDVHVYDPKADRWSAGAPLPAAVSYGAYARCNGSLEVFGGHDGVKTHRDSWQLDRADGGWRNTGSAPADTLFGRAEVFGDRTYLFGGCSDTADLSRCGDSVYVRDRNGDWSRASTMPQGRIAMPAQATARGRAYFFGGCSMDSSASVVNRDDAYSFDPSTGNWRRLRGLPRGNRGATAAALDDRYIVIVGGYTATQQEASGRPPDFGFTPSVLVYDIETDTYSERPSAPLAAAGMELVFHRNQLFAAGGEQRMRDRSDRLFVAALRR